MVSLLTIYYYTIDGPEFVTHLNYDTIIDDNFILYFNSKDSAYNSINDENH